MKITGKFLYELQTSPYSWDKTSDSVRCWWNDYADKVSIKVNVELSENSNNQDEQTDDSSGVPSQCLENEK